MANLMPINEHPLERGARVVLGLALVTLAATNTVGAWGYLGVLPILTGAVGSCPLYTVFGFSTCAKKAA